MAFLLNFILLVCFVLFLVVCMVGLFFYSSFRSISDRLKGGNGRTNSGRQGNGTYRRASDDEVIIDRRTPGEANRKIFSEGEGEYVDFEEEK